MALKGLFHLMFVNSVMATLSIQDATLSQLVAFDRQQDLLQVLLANCSYSLEAGHGALIEYDFDGIERQIEDRFIRGRPRLDHNQVCLLICY